jgi:hypothetical protein
LEQAIDRAGGHDFLNFSMHWMIIKEDIVYIYSCYFYEDLCTLRT